MLVSLGARLLWFFSPVASGILAANKPLLFRDRQVKGIGFATIPRTQACNLRCNHLLTGIQIVSLEEKNHLHWHRYSLWVNNMDVLRHMFGLPPTRHQPPRIESDDVYPVHRLDNTKTLRNIVVTWTLSFNDVLDADMLYGSLSR